MSKNSRKVSNENKQRMLFRPKFAQKLILGLKFRKSNFGFGISFSKIPYVPILDKTDNFDFFCSNLPKK